MTGGPRQQPGPLTQALVEILHRELQVRKRKKLITQHELAAHVGVSEGQMSKILNGKVNIEFEQAAMIVDILDEVGPPLVFRDVIIEAESKANSYRLNA